MGFEQYLPLERERAGLGGVVLQIAWHFMVLKAKLWVFIKSISQWYIMMV